MGGQQQRANKNNFSIETKDLLKKRKKRNNAESNNTHTHTCIKQLIRKRIDEDIKRYNEGLQTKIARKLQER